MPIFKKTKDKLELVREKPIQLESDIHLLTEKNSGLIFGLEFVSGKSNKQFHLGGFELDTLAFDPERKAFVIIEYKRDKSSSVVDQGFAYLSLMLNNKADFVLEYNEKKKKNLKKSDIDWSQSKVIFVANSFTPYQQKAIDFRDLPIELWEIKLFQNETILYNQLKPPSMRESIKLVSKNKTIMEVSKEIKEYTLEDHFERSSPKIRGIFNNIHEQTLNLGEDIREVIGKWAIIYKRNYTTFAYLYLRKSEIYCLLRLSETEDLKGVGEIRKVKQDDPFRISIKFDLDGQIDDALYFIKKAYETLV